MKKIHSFRALHSLTTHKLRLVVLILILALTGGLMASMKVSGQSSGPRPGQNDPVGNYEFPFPSHSVGAFIPNLSAGRIQVQGWRSDAGLQLSQAFSYGQPSDADQIVAAAGHIWRPGDEQTVYARRPAGGSNLHVVFVTDPPTNQASYSFNDLAPRVQNSADFMDIAVGDLDKLPDSDGNNHDEVVVAYAGPGRSSDGNLDYIVNVAVLDYTAPATVPPAPVAVTNTDFSFLGDDKRILVLNFSQSLNPGAADILPVDNVLGVAVGDFDGDGSKEIAVAHISDAGNMWITTLRYTNDGKGNRALRVASVANQKPVNLWAGTLDVAAADFDGKDGDELLTAVSEWTGNRNINQEVGFNVWQADGNLNMTRKAQFPGFRVAETTYDNLAGRARVQVSPGLFKYDPGIGFDLNRHQFVAAWNTWGINNRFNGMLSIATYQVADDLSNISQIKQRFYASGPNGGPGSAGEEQINQRFSIAAGAFRGNNATSSPLWGIALNWWAAADKSANSIPGLDLLSDDLSIKSTNTHPRYRYPVNVAARFPVLPFDLDGKSIYLGAPVHFSIAGTVNPDFILQEPPKHTFYDNRDGSSTRGKIVTVSRYDGMNVELKTSKGETFSGKSTDTSDWSIGGSLALSAGGTAGGNLAIAKTKVSLDVTVKVGYDYNQKKESYNSNYSSRTITQVERTDHDDKLLGRFQTLDIWRYRVYGVTATDPDGAPTNAFYEVILPGPTIDFNGGGLNFDWYQPLHENGNILSYPQAIASSFTPADLGTIKVPCPAAPPKGQTCNDDGTLTKSEPMVPAALNFFDGTSGSLAYDYANTTGSGNSLTYSHTLTESVDVKLSIQTNVDDFFTEGDERFSADTEFHNSNSWGGSKTSDTTTTSETGITLNRPSGDATQAYAFYPVFYATKDGVIKVTHAVDPLGSASGQAFWSNLYGRKADPALNLPQRFIPDYTFNILTGWVANDSATRKQMRGFFLRKPDLNPVTKDYDYLGSTPLAGDKVRVEARVYNYSTAVQANNLLVRFQAVAYDAASARELDPATGQPIDGQVPADKRTTIGETTIPLLNPRGQATASIVWDSKAIAPPLFNNVPASGSLSYRIYVVLDPANTIDETYETELADTIDPGQNNEGFGYVTFSHPAVGATAAARVGNANVHLRDFSLAGLDAPLNRNDPPQLKADQVRAFLGRPLRLRVATHSDQNHRALDHLLIYDGDPNKGGKLIAGKIAHTGDTRGSYVWIEWLPRTLGQHTLFARVLERSSDTKPGDNVDTLIVNVVPFDTVAPGIEVTLTPRELWPADGRLVHVAANIRVRDDLDQHPVVKLESITSSETRLGAIDIKEALFGTDDRQFLLRAQNLTATGPGRVYTVIYSVTDWAGNQTRYATTIRVRR